MIGDVKMISDEEAWSFMSGVAFGFLILGSILFVTVSIWGTSTSLYHDGYYEAYKQFRQNNIEQLVPKNIRLKYDIELLKETLK